MHSTGAQRVSKISAGDRYPGGRRRPAHQPRHAGANNLAKRVRDGFATMVKIGMDPRWESVAGRLFLEGKLSEVELQAIWLYAEAAARFDHFHTPSRRTAKSQAYEVSRGEIDEFELAIRDGSINDLERKARRVHKRWHKIVDIAGKYDGIVAKVALIDEVPTESELQRLKSGLGLLVAELKLQPYSGEVENRQREQAMPLPNRVRLAVDAIARWFENEGGLPRQFKVGQGDAGRRGVRVWGTNKAGAEMSHTVLIRHGTRDLVANIDSLFLNACVAAGWKERG